MNKPPIGIKPRFVWLDDRKIEIKEAIRRYLNTDLKIPLEWVKEYNQIIKEIGEENEPIN